MTTSGARRGSRLVRRLLVLEIVTVVLTAVIAGGVSAWTTRQTIEQDATDKVRAVAVALAASPGLPDAVAARDVARVQPAAEAARRGTGVSFVTIMDPAGTRLSHPEPSRIGETYQGTFAPAAAGATLVETFPGTLGLSVRAIVPLRDTEGAVVGMVAVGQLRVEVADRIARELAVLALAAAAAIALGVGLAAVAARRVKRDTLGLEPREITALHRHHEAVMAAMREGLLVLDAGTGRVVVMNAEAARLLDLPAPVDPSRAAGPTLDELGVDPALRERLADRSPVTDETLLVGERLLLVNRTEVAEAPTPDLVVTLRDRTELEAVTRELDDARTVTRALRFAAHEHANHLQAVSTLIELGAQDDARDLAQRWTRDLLGDDVADLRERLADPALAALVLDKATDARDRGLALRIGPRTALDAGDAGDEQASTDRVTVVGNLLDNALDAALESAHAGRGGTVELDVHAIDGAVVVRVADDGPGLADPDAAFTPGWSTKDRDGNDRRGLGLALVRRVVDRRGGRLEVGAGPDGRGTVFTVTLPVSPPVGSTSVESQPPAASR